MLRRMASAPASSTADSSGKGAPEAQRSGVSGSPHSGPGASVSQQNAPASAHCDSPRSSVADDG